MRFSAGKTSRFEEIFAQPANFRSQANSGATANFRGFEPNLTNFCPSLQTFAHYPRMLCHLSLVTNSVRAEENGCLGMWGA